MLPRWDPKLKDPESVAFTILGTLADLESEGKLKNSQNSSKNSTSSSNNTTTYPSETRSITAENSSALLLNPPQLGEKLNLEELTNHLLKKLQELPYAGTQADSTIFTNKKGQNRSLGNNKNPAGLTVSSGSENQDF